MSKGEYYAHPRNKFWRIVAIITNNKLPLSYLEKKALLLKTDIGIWDVAHKAYREGSLDTAILNEVPNDLDSFIASHKKLKVIGFNGTNAEKLYDKYFERRADINYHLLPSTSPANTTVSFENSCGKWRIIIHQ